MHLLRLILVSIALCTATALHAQEPPSRAPADSIIRQIIRTRDGSTFIGRVVSEDSASVRIETNGSVLTIARANLSSIETVHASDVHDGEYWFPDPNRTRLFFAPTARMLDEGEGYYMN